MRMRSLQLVLFLAITASLIVAACGGGSSDSSPGPTAAPVASATARPQATTAPAPTATAVPVSSGALRYGLSSVATYNLMPMISPGVNKAHIDPMYDPMLGMDNTGILSEKTGLVAAWTVTADGLGSTLKVRDGVVFHNGEQATSKDIKGSLEWYNSAEANAGVAANSRSRQLDRVETPDDATATLTFKVFDLFVLINHLSIKGYGVSGGYLLPAAYLNAKGFKEFDKNPVGSGPFKFKNAIVDQELNMEAVGRHWLYGVPRFQTLKVSIISEDGTRVALLKSGGAELVDIPRQEGKGLAAAGFDIAQKANSKHAKLQLTDQFIPVFKNGVKNPFSDMRVRLAMSLALDRESIMRDIMNGYGRPTMETFVAENEPGYIKYEVPKQDLPRARQLLAEAGYPKGFELDFVYWTLPGMTSEIPQYTEASAVWWEQIGLKVNRIQTGVQAGLNLIAKHDSERPLAINGWWSAISGFIKERLTATQSIKDGLYRFTEDPDVERLLKEMGAAKNMEEYTKAAQAYQKIYIDRVIDLPLFFGGEMDALKKGIGGDKWDLGKSTFNYNLAGLASGKPEIAR